MATSKEDMQNTKLTFRKFKDGDDSWRSWGNKIFKEDTSHKCPTYVHRTPPCQGSCPSGEDIRGWLDIVRGIEKPPADVSMQEYAFRRSTDANPFPSMMGRVCPAPCQDGCNRNHVEDFVGINSVEQYIGDTAFKEGFKFDNSAQMTGKKVAIIGGGPAGMAAAYQLRRKGIASTIFDDHAELGGMMRYGIPGYRTPRDYLNNECQRILDMGHINTRMNTRVGRDVSVEELENEYDAILWALGCWTGRGVPVEGWNETPNCVSAVNFLEQFNKGEMKYTGKKVLCIGGGDTSIDVVSVSRRIGTLANYSEKPEDVVNGTISHAGHDSSANVPCDSVVLTALFKQEEMTAAQHEVEDALIEGVKIMNEIMPIELIRDASGRATGMKFADCKWEKNAPVRVEGGKEYTVDADIIVAAIGQGGNLEGVEDLNNGRNLVDADNLYRVPGKANHYVCGDIVRPHLLTTAIGQAYIVSETIENDFNHIELKKRPKVDVHHFKLAKKMTEAGLSVDSYSSNDYQEDEQRGTDKSSYAIHNYEDRSSQEIISYDKLFLGHFGYEARNHRATDVPSSDEVLGHFTERQISLEEEKAVAEANRCMSCGMCFECDNCVIYCPQDAVFRVKKDKQTTGRYVDTDYNKCIGCHICSDVCPTGYIDMALGE
ncbi:MAG: FAD-dependent oxidoreductase [Gammaproteobacteria bacterium]|jgi:NADPH-dependent glutamate synthase beta subunit-like oxidoreductase/Pyruvate/2-oxoacid:ferredoxin oxidoreductase delta subunit|nr:FAD-dependent oxidoreductase [Gammaproteobacteria bacterium]